MTKLINSKIPDIARKSDSSKRAIPGWAAVLILCLIFTTWFLYNTKSDFPLIFKKDLLAHDESSNSVVAANITRKFFPPMVRVNPLNEVQGNWMEGPFWQHIPPLFAYVPYVFFKLDGQVTIEIKRLSFAFMTLLTGLLFIFSVYKYRKSLLAAVSATVAAIFWINTPFTHELITGYAFGVSDILLAFTVVCSFAAIICYLREDSEDRREYPFWKLALIGAIVALPIMAKNLLGAIPAATFFVLLLRDFWTRSNLVQARADESARYKILAPALSFLGMLALFFLPLYFASPETFKNEILVSFLHFKKLEGWERPWHWYVTNYLPNRYLFNWTWAYYLGLALGLVTGYRLQGTGRKDRILLWVSGGWFLWNLVAISLVTSKVPNFIYQSYLLSLFFIIYTALIVVSRFIDSTWADKSANYMNSAILPCIALSLAAAISVTGYETIRFAQEFKAQRAAAYNYQTEHEKFYWVAEQLREMKLDSRDLVIVNIPPNDCWMRYYILFLTGAESKTLLEMQFLNTLQYLSKIKSQYRRTYFVDNRFDIWELDIDTLDGILEENKMQIEQEIQRIKKDKQSCQWLVPDEILNLES